MIEEEKEEKEKNDVLYRITMTRDAEKALCDLLDRANTGFMGGRINRTQLVSWALMKLCRDVSEVDLLQLRAAHFDDVSALELLFRRAKETVEVSTELKAILMKEVGFSGSNKKNSKKAN